MKKPVNIFIFIITTLALIISAKLFYNLGIYADQYGVSSDIVLGGNFWLLMDWLRLFILLILSIFSFVKLFNAEK